MHHFMAQGRHDGGQHGDPVHQLPHAAGTGLGAQAAHMAANCRDRHFQLRGDLRSQGREIASLNTADMQGFVKNAAFTWGVVVNPKDGLAYVNDYNNGLWVIKIEPKLKKIVP